MDTWEENSLLSPFILPPDLLLLLGRKVILNVERFTDLLWRLPLDHVRDGLAADVKQGLDVEIVGGQNDLEQHLLVDLHEFLVPLVNVGGLLARVGVVVVGGRRVLFVLATPLDDLAHDWLVDLWGCSC